jgi:pilus assembly protein Flp/PilA
MLALFKNAANLRRDEKGATAVEYGIMVALIAVVIIVAVTLLGGNLNSMFNDVSCKVQGKTYGSAVVDDPGTAADETAAAGCK